MKLGAMLVRDGRLTPEQLEQALEHQRRSGMRLGTAFVELGLLDTDTITIYLGLELSIPIATVAVMERAKRAAVKLLSAQAVERYVVLPLVVQDRHLICAMRDPHDLVLLDELERVTGYQVIPRVASEIRLYHYIERYYGVARPERFRALDWAVHGRPPGVVPLEPPAPPLPGLPPPVEHPVQPPANAKTVDRPMPSVPTLDTISVEDAYDELALEMDEIPGERAGESLPTDPPFTGAAPIPTSAPPVVAATPTGPARKLEGAEAIQLLKEARTRAEISDLVLDHARSILATAALLVVREELAFGWRGFGPTIDAGRLETLLVPLQPPSIFQIASTTGHFHGAPPRGALVQHVYRVLKLAIPTAAVVVRIAIGDRPVNLLVGQREDGGELPAPLLTELRNVSAAAGAAYTRLIAGKKQTA